MTSLKTLFQESSNLDKKVQEFEYRKVGTLTFFERCCAKKTPEKRREVFFCLKDADWDFNEGVMNGYDAPKAFERIRHLGFDKEWAESLKYVYWFSSPKERHAFKNHVVAGVVASRPELYQPRIDTGFQEEATSDLGKKLYLSQNDLVWRKKSNPLTIITQDGLARAEQIVQIVRNAQKDTDEKGLKAGIRTMVSGLMPFFFRPEQEEFSKDKANGPSYKLLQSIARKKNILTPLLKGHAWLFLTQGKYYQNMEIRDFIEHHPQNPQQMLLDLSFGRDRTE